MKSIPVVQQVYQAILADMTANFNVLLQIEPTISDLNEDKAEAALIFDCSALCQIGNIKGNLIGVKKTDFVRIEKKLKTTFSFRCTR